MSENKVVYIPQQLAHAIEVVRADQPEYVLLKVEEYEKNLTDTARKANDHLYVLYTYYDRDPAMYYRALIYGYKVTTDPLYWGEEVEAESPNFAELETRVMASIMNQPPENWSAFLQLAVQTHVEKNTDYDSRFMRALAESIHFNEATAIWAWEVDKKLDRIRTWLQRGELLVKGEGLVNAVVDLFNYTVQYCIWSEHDDSGNMEYLREELSEPRFHAHAAYYTPVLWTEFLEREARIREGEAALSQILQIFMGYWAYVGGTVNPSRVPQTAQEVLQDVVSRYKDGGK